MMTVYRRKSLRIQNYDYSQNGAYFFTICTNEKEVLLDKEKVKAMIIDFWRKLPEKFNHAVNDEIVVMPNHVHAILFLVGADPCVCPMPDAEEGEHAGSPLQGAVKTAYSSTAVYNHLLFGE